MSAAIVAPVENPFDDKKSPTTRAPPPPPPKKHRQQKPKDIVEEVRDTVQLRTSPTRMNRSQTATGPQNTSSPRTAPQLGPRSVSHDSGPDKKSKPRKKGSQHADVIDRLDFTGVGPMFHHDGPFDACAPSRNRQKNKAPMNAWTPRPEDSSKEYNDNPYPSPNAMSAFSSSDYEPPKKKVDAIAEAWGIHEPEPYEEFFAGGGTNGDTPGSSIYNGKESNRKPADPPRPRQQARRSVLPPPMPIFVPDAADVPGSRQPGLSRHPFPDASVNGERPTHRSQNSFLGRFGNGNANGTSNEAYVFIEPKPTSAKDLPASPGSPGDAPANGYFDGPGTTPPSGGGLGRKTSLMKKVGRVVRGAK
ncbi:Pal1 cell morphology protein-domain-containing protein [Mycena rebaudengoi]|nr:Pal1 cell morphology protein-domain-containing protein [Mycena rebaudengoi]